MTKFIAKRIESLRIIFFIVQIILLTLTLVLAWGFGTGALENVLDFLSDFSFIDQACFGLLVAVMCMLVLSIFFTININRVEKKLDEIKKILTETICRECCEKLSFDDKFCPNCGSGV
ncbi:hypothetical protein tpqmel_0123 [Candidatus Gastranaerophilus sp. (ex Termes propinquus)]|nr:hypothetical protein tpqmel_0123 [Candidatus Gastranaerophilus sp. (ex Termes propinquus)]